MAPTPHPPLATVAAPAAVASARAVKVPAWFTVAAALRVARLKRVDHLLVVDRQTLVGTLPVSALRTAAPHHPIARWMTPITTVTPLLRLVAAV